MNTLFSKPNAVYILKLLVQKLKIPVSTYTLAQEVKAHPDYPSMLALSDCLSNWNVPNQAFKVDKENCQLEDLPLPFIAHLKTEGGTFVLISETDPEIVYSDEHEKSGRLAVNEFMEQWDGVMLYAEKDMMSGEQNFRQSVIEGILEKARWPFFALIILLSILYTIDFNSVTPAYLGVLAVKLAGVFVSVLLLIHSVNAGNPFIQNLCSLGKQNNCNAILKSPAAKITSWLSWSEVGMFYFSGSLIALLANSNLMSWLALMNLCCLPYTFYSIGYQLKTRNWCILCCSVQALLWIEAIGFALSRGTLLPDFIALDLKTAIGLILSFCLPLAAWAFIKPFFVKADQVAPLQQHLKKFKYNINLFEKFISSQAKYSVSDDLMPITLGNPNAQTVITMVSNPFCGPCASAHQKLHNLLQQRDDIQLKIVFTTANHDDDMRTKVARHATALGVADIRIAEKALNDWYNQASKNYDTWAEKYPVAYNDAITDVIDKQKHWCKMAEISFTPTLLINGYKLSDPYYLDDIKYLLE